MITESVQESVHTKLRISEFTGSVFHNLFANMAKAGIFGEDGNIVRAMFS